MYCERSGTVKRLIYTASVVAASPLKDDGTGFKDFMDETCWTPLNLSIPYSNDDLRVSFNFFFLLLLFSFPENYGSVSQRTQLVMYTVLIVTS